MHHSFVKMNDMNSLEVPYEFSWLIPNVETFKKFSFLAQLNIFESLLYEISIQFPLSDEMTTA